MLSLGFIGLGHMGLPMALNLLKAGYQVYGFDLSEQALCAFEKAGGKRGEDLTQAARELDTWISMLPSGESLRRLCFSLEGLFDLFHKNTLYIDCSTIDIATSHLLHREGQKRGLAILDAPVSGGVAGAGAGTLSFLVGGESVVFERAKPLFQAMGKKLIHTGGAASGQAAKICNNMILGISMVAISEAFLLAEKLGLSATKLQEVVSSASGQCWAMDHYVPVPDVLPNMPANQGYKPGFTAAMMLKDLCLSQAEAKQNALDTALAAEVTAIYQHLDHLGLGQSDFSIVFQHLKSINEKVEAPEEK